MIALHALLADGARAGTTPVCRVHDTVHDFDAFRRRVRAIARAVQKRPAQRYALCLENAFDFACALFALLACAREPVIPGSFAPGYLAALAGAYDVLMTDDELRRLEAEGEFTAGTAETETAASTGVKAGAQTRPGACAQARIDARGEVKTNVETEVKTGVKAGLHAVASRESRVKTGVKTEAQAGMKAGTKPPRDNPVSLLDDIPGRIDPHAPLVLYTSGSSDTPRAIRKSLAQFDAEVATQERQWGALLGGANMPANVLASVPHHHIYGILFRIFWPLAAGRMFDCNIVTDPATLGARLNGNDNENNDAHGNQNARADNDKNGKSDGNDKTGNTARSDVKSDHANDNADNADNDDDNGAGSDAADGGNNADNDAGSSAGNRVDNNAGNRTGNTIDNDAGSNAGNRADNNAGNRMGNTVDDDAGSSTDNRVGNNAGNRTGNTVDNDAANETSNATSRSAGGAASRTPGRAAVVISTPAHLSRWPTLPGFDSLGAGLGARLTFFSSGGPLDGKTASLYAAKFGSAPIEIYGSTETGGIAWRRQNETQRWQPLPGVEVRIGAHEDASGNAPDALDAANAVSVPNALGAPDAPNAPDVSGARKGAPGVPNAPDARKDAPETASGDARKDTPENVPENARTGVLDARKDAPESAFGNARKDAPESVLENAPEDTRTDVLESAPRNTLKGALEIRSAHLGHADWYRTDDEIALDISGTSSTSSTSSNKDAPRAFTLLGRLDRVVKIDGKRVSLAALEARLGAHPGIAQAVAVALEGRARTRVGVLAALSAAGHAALRQHGHARFARQLRQYLLAHFDPVAVPRQWRFVSALPFDARGKLPANLVRARFATHPLGFDLLSALQSGEENGGEYRHESRYELRIPHSLAYFAGHFPGLPILPGVVQVDWAVKLAADQLGRPAVVAALDQLKFTRPVPPGARLSLTLAHDVARGRTRFVYARSNSHDYDGHDERDERDGHHAHGEHDARDGRNVCDVHDVRGGHGARDDHHARAEHDAHAGRNVNDVHDVHGEHGVRGGHHAPDGHDARDGRNACDVHNMHDEYGARDGHHVHDERDARAGGNASDVHDMHDEHGVSDGHHARDGHDARAGRNASDAHDVHGGHGARDGHHAHDEHDAHDDRNARAGHDTRAERITRNENSAHDKRNTHAARAERAGRNERICASGILVWADAV